MKVLQNTPCETSQLNRANPYYRVVVLFSVPFLMLPGLSSAQDTAVESVHWAYSSFLGTGWYKLDQDRQVYVLRIPPRWYYQQPSIDESDQRSLGIEFHFPLTFGLQKLEGIGDFLDTGNIGTVSFTPGVEIVYPVSTRWQLRAYGHFGWGTAAASDDSAWIYDAGLKSRYKFQNGKLDWAIVNEVFFAGYRGKESGRDNLNGMMTGMDFGYPLGSGSRTGTALKLDWDISYRWYGNDLSFTRTLSRPVSIRNEWQIGVAIARRDGPIKIWFLEFEHVGLIYRFNNDGSFRAITVNFRSPFTR